jgi:hypothetical protein
MKNYANDNEKASLLNMLKLAIGEVENNKIYNIGTIIFKDIREKPVSDGVKYLEYEDTGARQYVVLFSVDESESDQPDA